MRRSNIFKHLVVVAALLCAPTPVQADDTLDLARVLVAEGGRTKTPDHVAILYVLQHRKRLPAFRQMSLAHVARAYSVAFNGRSRDPERALRMRTMTRDNIPVHILRLVSSWQNGQRPSNPCPGATHFASTTVRTPLRSVVCTQPTRNAFYGT